MISKFISICDIQHYLDFFHDYVLISRQSQIVLLCHFPMLGMNSLVKKKKSLKTENIPSGTPKVLIEQNCTTKRGNTNNYIYLTH